MNVDIGKYHECGHLKITYESENNMNVDIKITYECGHLKITSETSICKWISENNI